MKNEDDAVILANLKKITKAFKKIVKAYENGGCKSDMLSEMKRVVCEQLSDKRTSDRAQEKIYKKIVAKEIGFKPLGDENINFIAIALALRNEKRIV